MNLKDQALSTLQWGLAKTSYRVVTGRLADADRLIEVFARWSTGILHIGGHLAQESEWYASLEKPVVWIEAMPEATATIREVIRNRAEQSVFQACLADIDNQAVRFNVSSNGQGASSSLFSFGTASVGSKSMWPDLDLRMTHSLELKTITLDTLARLHEIPMSRFDHWIVDVQGAELLVLNGAKESLSWCRSLVVEASSIDVYDGGARWPDVSEFLQDSGFIPLWECLGHMDVLFVRRDQHWQQQLKGMKGFPEVAPSDHDV